jgi:hypothetical protein
MGVDRFIGRLGRNTTATAGRPQHESAQNTEKAGWTAQVI